MKRRTPFSRRAACVAVAAGLALAAAIPAGTAAATLAVRDIRCSTTSDRTRVVLDMSGVARYSVRALAGPHRIVIEIPGCAVAKGVKAQEVGDGLLDRVRVNRLAKSAQIVLDIPRATEFSHFALKPSAGKPHRIVVDLAAPPGSGKPAPAEEPPSAAERTDDGPGGVPKAAKAAGFVIAIDPGHGGEVPGAVSKSGVKEKTLNLKLARMLKEELERRGGCRAVLTRDGDHDLLWYKRILKAREHGADVFVSLHFNGQQDRKVRGIELYMISPEGVMDENAESVAEREHLMQEVEQQGTAVNGDLESILFDVSRSNAMQRSAFLTEEIARVLQKDPPIPFRTVRQKNFIVLRGISMPSILVEGGYLSNKKEASIISKDAYLRWLAKSLADGIFAFLDKHPQTETAAGE